MIYHIAHKKDWQAALSNDTYQTDSLETEGFIHCSPKEKIFEIANNFYKGQNGLVLLVIDESKVKAKIIREDLYNHNFEFPHIYGELNLDAVIDALDFKSSEDGMFIFP